MKKVALFTVLIFIIGLMVVPMVMAQAKPAPAKEPAKAPAPAKPVAKPAATKEPIKLGVLCDFAGPCYTLCDSGVRGIRMAQEEINAKGGILGRKLEVSIRDTEAKVDVGAREAKDLILDRKSVV